MTQEIKSTQLLAAISLLVVLAGMLGGCYDHQEVHQFIMTPRKPVSGVEYRIMPPDMLLITSRHIPEIDKAQQIVRPDGKVNLPLLGEIEVAKKTPKEVEEAIKQVARKYYAEVDATVMIAGYNSQRYYIFGQVSRPGPMAWTGHDTLLDALAQAQPTFLGWPERITVVRGREPQEGGQGDHESSLKYAHKGVHPAKEGEEPKKITVNLWAMVKSGDMANNILLMPNDVIYVKPHPLAAIGLGVQSLLLPIRPASETIQAPVSAAASVGGM